MTYGRDELAWRDGDACAVCIEHDTVPYGVPCLFDAHPMGSSWRRWVRGMLVEPDVSLHNCNLEWVAVGGSQHTRRHTTGGLWPYHLDAVLTDVSTCTHVAVHAHQR